MKKINPPLNTTGREDKPKVNEAARIVNSRFLQSPYQGKDWESVRLSLISELTDLVERREREVTPEVRSEISDLMYQYSINPSNANKYYHSMLALYESGQVWKEEGEK